MASTPIAIIVTAIFMSGVYLVVAFLRSLGVVLPRPRPAKKDDDADDDAAAEVRRRLAPAPKEAPRSWWQFCCSCSCRRSEPTFVILCRRDGDDHWRRIDRAGKPFPSYTELVEVVSAKLGVKGAVTITQELNHERVLLTDDDDARSLLGSGSERLVVIVPDSVRLRRLVATEAPEE